MGHEPGGSELACDRLIFDLRRGVGYSIGALEERLPAGPVDQRVGPAGDALHFQGAAEFDSRSRRP